MSRPLVRLAWPMLAGHLFQIGFNYADTWYVGFLGKDALAAVGSTMFVVWALLSFAEVVTVGVLALVARAIGARVGEEAGAVTLAGAVALAVLSLCVGSAGALGVDTLVGFLGLGEVPTRLAGDYLRILFLGYPALACFLLIESVFRGAGDTRTPMIVLAGTFFLNIGLDRALIFGLGPIPAFGVAGAAAATVGSRLCGCALLVAFLLRRRHALGILRPQGPWLELARVKRIARIGAPASLAGLTFCGIYMLLVRITSEFGTAPVAALGLAIRLESIGFYVAVSLGRSAAAIAGQCMGAGRVERAARAARRAEWLACLAMAPLVLAMLCFAEPIVGLFIDDAEVIEAAASYLRILSWTMPLLCIEFILDSVASGVGDTLPASLIEVGGTALRIPLALLLASAGLGYAAVWWAIALTVALKAAAFEVWFRLGRWKELRGAQI